MKLIATERIPHPAPVEFSQTAFLSFVPWGDGYLCAYREFTPEKSDTETMVLVQRYGADLEPVGKSTLLLVYGEDPRAFLWNERPMALFTSWSETKQDHLVWMADLETGAVRGIAHDLEYAGKNWMPVPDGEKLLLIRSLDPLCVLELSGVTDTRAKTVLAPSHPRDIGPHRRGGAASMEGRMIIGCGHRTVEEPLSHTPFLFAIHGDATQFDVMELEGFGDYTVIDPTSQIDDRLIVSAARGSWWEPQEIATFICEMGG